MHTTKAPTVSVKQGRRTNRSQLSLVVTGWNELPYQLRSFVESIPGVRARNDVAYIPRDPRMLELLLHAHQDIMQLSDGVRYWYNLILRTEKAKVARTLLEDIDLPGTDTRLRPYQRVGVNFILRNRRCILADDIGLGKTAQAIEAIEHAPVNKRVLVICPNTSKWWWSEEIDEWYPNQFRVVVEAKTRQADLKRYGDREGFLIINWALVRLMPELSRYIWHWVIADEAHRLSNRKTQRWAHFKNLIAKRMVFLTGTPIHKSPADLWALLHLLFPNRYTSYWRFFEMYVNYRDGWHGYKEIDRADPVRNKELLQREIAPIMIQRSKDKYRTTLPPQDKTIPVPLTPTQSRMYRTMAKEMYAILEDDTAVEVFDVGAQITRLRQIVSTTATLQDTDFSSKLDAAEDIILDAPEEQFVVFTLFRATVFALQARLRSHDVVCAVIIGGQSAEDRHIIVGQFQASKIRVIISTVQAGGESITLTASHQVMFIEKHFSHIVQQQAIGRVDRFGQTMQCQITSIICPHTVDQLVEKIVESKREMVRKVLVEAFFENLQDSLEYL